MELNVPTTGIVSHESPAVVQLHEDTKVPVSEIKAKLHNKIMELNQNRLENPSEVPFGNSTEDMKEQGYKEVENELLHPEENQTVQDEEFKNFFGDTYPGSEAFAAPVEEGDMPVNNSFNNTGFSSGFDNNAMGFSDEDMATLDATAENAFNDFTSQNTTQTAADVNNVSATNPTAEKDENATDTATDNAVDEPPVEEAPVEA